MNFKPKSLNPQAVQQAQNQRIARAAQDTSSQSCVVCSHNVFVVGSQIKVLSPIVTGLPKTAIVPAEQRYLCAKCGKQWILGEEKEDEQEATPEDQSPLS